MTGGLHGVLPPKNSSQAWGQGLWKYLDKVADAQPAGKRPFQRQQYIEKFKNLTEGIISEKESKRFINLVQNLRKLNSNKLTALNVEVLKRLKKKQFKKFSIF